MLGRTHRVGGICTGLVCVATMYGLDNISNNKIAAGVIIASSVIGSLLPDIDSEKSTISKTFPIMSTLICQGETHRGIMHTLVPYLIVSPILAIITYIISKISNIIIFGSYSIYGIFVLFYIGLIAGIINHLFLDMLTPCGAPILYPIVKKNISIAKLNGGKHGPIISFIMITLTLLYLAYAKNGNFAIIQDMFTFIIDKFKSLYEAYKTNGMVQMN